jgi:cyclopropane fatty-acyl-phospholipid synthase-like methyltransferase
MFEKIANQFKKPSGFLGKIVASLMIKGNRHAYNTLMNDLKILPTDKLLEIGYGPGLGINLIAESIDSCNIYGIDFSELMYKRATKRNKLFIAKNRVRLLFGDFIETNINTTDFDKIFCLNVVYFWDDLMVPFTKIRSLLKTDGIFHFYMAKKEDLDQLKFTSDDVFNKYSIDQVTDALKLSGFSTIDSHFNKGYFVKARK